MVQRWERLLFAHWRVPVQELRRVVPDALPLDEHDGSAWLGVTPFVVASLRPRGLPRPPFAGRFPELNVRTYTTVDGRPGIVFLSLDAGSRLAVAGARLAYRLPYFHARMRVACSAERVEYSSRRGAAALRVRYGPAGAAFEAAPGTLEHFLTERYCLFTVDERGRVRRTDIRHAPWRLQPAFAVLEENTKAAAHGLVLARRSPLLHFAARQDVAVWPPRRQA
jgi:uncharacterized protein YqjF (DUF2071 family)